MGDGHEGRLAATRDDGAKVLESVILKGDISALTPAERVQYYKAVCDSVGLNPLTQPFAYITLSGKATLYAKRDATDQLRKIHGVSVTACKTERVDDIYIVTVGVQDKTGRTDMATGVVTIGASQGDTLANAMMKAETKAKRRATLSICGLGLLDETELDTIHEKAPFKVTEEAKAEVTAIEQKVKEIFKKDEPTPIHNYSEAAPDRSADLGILKADFDERLEKAESVKVCSVVRDDVSRSELDQAWKDGFYIRWSERMNALAAKKK